MLKHAMGVATALALSALLAGSALAATSVKIGAIEDLTGPTAKYGVSIKDGFDLADAEINAKGGVLHGEKLVLDYKDAAGQKGQAINAARELIGSDHVVAILGPTLSNEMFAVGPVANGRSIPIIGTSTTANGITAIGKWVFRTSLPESDVVPVTIREAQAKYHFKTVALMYSNDDAFTKSGFDVMKAALEKQGIKIADIEAFSKKDTDFSAQLTKIKGLHVGAICVSALAEAGAGVILQARQLGIPMSVPIIGGNGFNSPKIAQIAGKSAEGVIVGSPWFIGKPTAANKAFVAAFRAKYHQDPDQFAAQAYDTLFILAAAIDRAGSTNNEKLHAALLATNYDGVMGPFRFTADRNPASTKGVVVLAVTNGQFALLK